MEPEPLIIDPRLVILRHGFERLDLNHQSNERPSTDKNDQSKIVVPWSVLQK
jgi:hypothetical protein